MTSAAQQLRTFLLTRWNAYELWNELTSLRFLGGRTAPEGAMAGAAASPRSGPLVRPLTPSRPIKGLLRFPALATVRRRVIVGSGISRRRAATAASSAVRTR